EPEFEERVRVMRRHLELMAEVFGPEHGCRLFRKVGPWYARQFGPAREFNRRIVTLSSIAEFDDILDSYRLWRRPFLDAQGRLQPKFRPPLLAPSFMRQPPAAGRAEIPVPKGPVEIW